MGESGLEPELPRRAALYFWLVAAVATAATAPFLVDIQNVRPSAWVTFVVLGAAVAVAQIFVVVTPANQSYHTTGVFLVASALLLPPELIALMAVVQHVPDWLKRRLPFHIQTFNIANYTLATLGAAAAADGIRDSQVFGRMGATPAIAYLAASVVFVAVNHALLAPMLRFARGHSLRE